jgi:hypothetical protein
MVRPGHGDKRPVSRMMEAIMYQVVVGDEIITAKDLDELKREFGAKSEYTPDCGTIGDILIRHPFNPSVQLRAMYYE